MLTTSLILTETLPFLYSPPGISNVAFEAVKFTYEGEFADTLTFTTTSCDCKAVIGGRIVVVRVVDAVVCMDVVAVAGIVVVEVAIVVVGMLVGALVVCVAPVPPLPFIVVPPPAAADVNATAAFDGGSAVTGVVDESVTDKFT